MHVNSCKSLKSNDPTYYRNLTLQGKVKIISKVKKRKVEYRTFKLGLDVL